MSYSPYILSNLLHYRLPLLDCGVVNQLADRRRYLQLSKLLLENRNSNFSERTISVINDCGQICSSGTAASKRKTGSFESWLEAFLIFVHFRVFYRPKLAPNLSAYLDITGGMVLHRLFNVRCEYERCFENVWYTQMPTNRPGFARTLLS